MQYIQQRKVKIFIAALAQQFLTHVIVGRLGIAPFTKRLTASSAISLSTVSYIYWDNYVYYTDYLLAIHYFALHVPELLADCPCDVIFCLVKGTIIVVELFGQ